MIERNKIEQLIDENLQDKDLFLVDFTLSTSNHIEVFIDSDNGQVSIADCVTLSRHIESNLDREEEDFELNVSSAGLDIPLKKTRQYKKHVGKRLNLQMNDGSQILLDFKELLEDGIAGTPLKKNPNAKKGSKRPYIELEAVSLSFDDIREAKIEVIF
jgi:ribosome maturation factor RimP